MLIHIPNLLTLFRVALIPVLVVVYFLPIPAREMTLTGIFIIAAVTDWLDGFLARYMNAISPLGTFLDPVADKLVVSTALVLLVSDSNVLNNVLHPIPFAVAVAVIIGREIVVSALREWMAELGDRCVIAVSKIGKFKTAFQMISIGILLYGKPIYDIPVFRLGEVLLYLAALLTLWSMVQYLRAAYPFLWDAQQ